MRSLTDDEILESLRGEPAPLLPILHAFHDRDGYLSPEALKVISKGLRIPIADLYGTIDFYHHFSTGEGGHHQARVCTGPICCLKEGNQILEALRSQGATPMPCAGRCDDPVVVLKGNQALLGTSAENLQPRRSPLPPEAPTLEGFEECVFAHIRSPERSQFAGYRSTGGYNALEKACSQLSQEDLLSQVEASGLAGRGGAGFPTGSKWRAVFNAPGDPKSIVCNADEGEPGCFKDRALLDHDPHAVIEGMALAAYATGAERGFIYLRYEYPETYAILEQAINDAESNGFLGENILGKFNFKLYLRRGAGAYICGEEGSLLNSLEGKHPFPRNRPPFPVTHGFEDLPTVVNNVETLASVPPIVLKGADWYQCLGHDQNAGTKVISLSGDVNKPGNYEIPIGFPLMHLIQDWAGGTPSGKRVQAVTMAGLSGGFLAGEDLDVTLDEPCIRSKGSFLGAGGIMVFDETRDMVEIAHQAMEFFAEESCGKCFPCRIGTRRLSERLGGHAGPGELTQWLNEVEALGQTMKATSSCGLGIAAPLISDSLVKYFPEQVENHVKS